MSEYKTSMQAASSVSTVFSNKREVLSAGAIGAGPRAILLLLNLVPLLFAGSCLALFALLPFHWPVRLLGSIACLYLAPPLLGRLIQARGMREGRLAVGTGAFNAWWALMQLQVLFSRFPALEELLRILPGIYSGWLRLWGARIGRLTYWAPGVRILDRPSLHIGNDVVIGAGVQFSSHVFTRGREATLLLATIDVGDEVCVGGYSVLSAGARIADGETTCACLRMAPYALWDHGRLRQRRTAE